MKMKSIVTVQSLAIALLAISVEQANAAPAKKDVEFKAKQSPDHIRVPKTDIDLKTKQSPDHIRVPNIDLDFKTKQSSEHIRGTSGDPG